MKNFKFKAVLASSLLLLVMEGASTQAFALDVIDSIRLLKQGQTGEVAKKLDELSKIQEQRRSEFSRIKSEHEMLDTQEKKELSAFEAERFKIRTAAHQEQEKVSNQYSSPFGKFFSRIFKTENVTQLEAAERSKLEEQERLAGKFQSEQERRLDQLKREESDLRRIEAQTAQAQRETTQFLDEVMKYDQDFRKRMNLTEEESRDPQKVYRAFMQLNEHDRKIEAVSHQARKIYDQQRQDGFDTQLLLSDVDTLKTKFNLDQMQVDAMKIAIDNQLNGTLLGEYVNQQISKIGHNFCELQDECAKASASGTAADLERKISAALQQNHQESRKIANQKRPAVEENRTPTAVDSGAGNQTGESAGKAAQAR